MESPVGALAWPVRPSRDLDEAVVETEVVPEGVLPALGVFPVVREIVHDELVDLGERKHPLLAMVEGHCSECYVGVGGLRVPVGLPGRPWHGAQSVGAFKQMVVCWNPGAQALPVIGAHQDWVPSYDLLAAFGTQI